MSTKKEKNILERVRTEVTEQSRNVWLAGLGAVATVEEEGTKLYDQLVKRGEDFVKKGEEFERRGSDQVKQLVDDFNKQQEAIGRQLTDTTDEITRIGTDAENRLLSAVNEALERIGVPTKRRVQSLADKVHELSKKVDRLTRALEPGATVKGAATVVDRLKFVVSPHEEGWQVQQAEADDTPEIFATKKEAVEAGRKQAREHAPSELIVQKQDGTIQETFTYDSEK